MAGRGDAKKKSGKRPASGTKRPTKSTRDKKPLVEKPESNRGKRGSSREKDMAFRTDTKANRQLSDKRSGDKKYSDKPFGEKPKRENSFGDKTRGDKSYGDKSRGDKSYGDNPRGEKSFAEKKFGDKKYGTKKPYGRSEGGSREDSKFSRGKKKTGQGETKQFFTSNYGGEKPEGWKPKKFDGLMRLNKFLSNAGIASRRDADKLIELGLVKVNDKVITELGYKVDPKTDTVKYDDKNLRPEKLQYVLLNKPKDYITTMDDPEERKTVMWLVKDACKERIYPVGRLDRLTTGLLLFTNDGELAKKLTHPKHGIQKLYHVETIEKIKAADIDAMREGLKLEDGFIKADEVSYVNDDPRQVGIRIHSGRNRIVRRMFEHFNYTVKKLDRVMFAGLTKKDLPRGRCRHLSEQELAFLKML